MFTGSQNGTRTKPDVKTSGLARVMVCMCTSSLWQRTLIIKLLFMQLCVLAATSSKSEYSYQSKDGSWQTLTALSFLDVMVSITLILERAMCTLI